MSDMAILSKFLDNKPIEMTISKTWMSHTNLKSRLDSKTSILSSSICTPCASPHSLGIKALPN